MRGFRFRLQTVLDIRQREEDVRSRELAEALGILEAERAKLHELRVREADALAEYHRLQKVGQLDVMAIQWFQTYSVGLSVSINEQIRRITEAEGQVDQRRAMLLEAARAKQVLDQLKEQAREAYLKEADRKEAHQLDEIATLRHTRRQAIQRPRTP